MTDSHDHLPTDFDLSYFDTPSTETLAAFEGSILSLRNIAEYMVTDGLTDYFFKHGFKNGSKVAFNDSEVSAGSRDPGPATATSERRVVLETEEGVIYEYQDGARNGGDILVIQRMGLDATRELMPTETLKAEMREPYAGQSGDVNVTFIGGVDHPLRQKVVLFIEAKAKGTDVPTEGKVTKFTQEINDAVNSGVDDSGQLDLTDFAIW